MKTKIILSTLLLLSTLSASETKFFLAQGIGLSKHKVTVNNKVGNVVLDQKPTSSGKSTNFEFGYTHTKDYFSTFQYSTLSYTEIDIQNIILTFNKKYIFSSFDTYVGVAAGISKTKLNTSLINGVTTTKTGQSNIYGIQTGIDKALNEGAYIYVQYQFLKTNQKRIIKKSGSISELKRDNYSNVSIGVKFTF